MAATLTLKAQTGDGAYYVKDDTVTFVLDSAADTEKTAAGTKVATWTKESNTLGIVADAAALTISSDADYPTGATISGLRATDTVTLKDGDKLTFASAAAATTTVKLPATGTVTVEGTEYTTASTATDTTTVTKSGTVALGAQGDNVKFGGVTYTATAGTDIKIDSKGTVTGATETDVLTVSAAEGTTATVTLDSSYTGKLTVDKAGKGTVNVVGLTNLDNLTAQGTN